MKGAREGRSRAAWSFALAGMMAGCAAERTVLRTESRMGFSEAWSQQIGDEAKIKEKYASGFEIKDGRAVATGDKQAPFEKKAFAAETLEREAFEGVDRDVERKMFSGKREYGTEAFEPGTPARETRKVSRWQGSRVDLGETAIPSVSWRDGERMTETGTAPEAGKRFRMPGGRNNPREAPLVAGKERYGIDVSDGEPLAAGSGGGTVLSVDDVRGLLSPELTR